MYFIKSDEHWDIVGLAAAEIGTLFISLVLITGPIWATLFGDSLGSGNHV
tara:strand:- start:308 stop:457 length:150 start_codon:yes stop_codon:yes gene_type:complete